MGLLLLHGALGSAQQMKPLQDRIGGVAIDLSGHATRGTPADGIRFEHFITDIDEAFAANDWSTADLFGYSMGGYAAMLYAAKHPQRVRSVVTVGTKYLWTEDGLQKELRKLDPDAMVVKVPAFAQALADVHGEDRWRDVVAAIAKSMTDLAASPLLTEEVCKEIQCPALLCVGDMDTTAIAADTVAFAQRVPHAEVQVLENTRHPFEDLKLDVLVERVGSFWSWIDQ